MSSKRSVFISYHTSENLGTAEGLHNYFEAEGREIDSYYDREEPVNNGPLSAELEEAILSKDNFVLLSSKKSLEDLIAYKPALFDDSDNRNWVYEELETAIKGGKSIIPVFLDSIDDAGGENNIRKLYQKLFQNLTKSRNNEWHIVLRERYPIDSNNDFYQAVTKCLSYPQVSSNDSQTDMSDIYWVGTRFSDIGNLKDKFKGHIVLFADTSDDQTFAMCPKESEERVDHNDASDITQDEFYKEKIENLVKQDHTAKFMFYNPATVFRLGFDDEFIKKHVVCLNDRDLINRISNKIEFRKMMNEDNADTVPLLPIKTLARLDCDYEKLMNEKESFRDNNDYGCTIPPITYDEDLRFIVQAPESSGGSGTFVLSKFNSRYLLSSLHPRTKYLVSIYHTKNVPVNVHVLIAKKQIILLPASVQLECEVESENKLLYKGADFIAYRQLSFALRNQFEDQAHKVAEKLQEKGYRGVLGIDAIIHNGRVNILEVNPRFQASTELINRALCNAKRKTIQELNLECFTNGTICDADIVACAITDVDFSNFTFSNEGHLQHDKRIHEVALKEMRERCGNEVAAVQDDGYNPDLQNEYRVQAYLFRIVFYNNIASISEDGDVWINENIVAPKRQLFQKIKAKEKLAVKLALLIQGIIVEPEINEKLRLATNNAVDLQIGKGKNSMVINAPTKIRYNSFSPFDLKASKNFKGRYVIHHYDEEFIDNVGIFPADKNQEKTCENSDSKSKRQFSEIAYLSTDRLRVHLTNACKYKLSNRGCCFCNIPVEKNMEAIHPADIKEVVEQYMTDKKRDEAMKADVYLRHFLIGGQSLADSDEKLVEIAQLLRRYHLPIYIMTLPLKEETVYKLVNNGVLEFSYNIEIFNEKCRKKYMPGKSEYSVVDYLTSLKRTREILNGSKYNDSHKVVRSMLIIGLEPWQDMLDGIKKLIDCHIEPMLSVFRPLPGTALEDQNAPPILSVYDLFHTVSEQLYLKSAHRDEETIEWNDETEELEGEISEYQKLGPNCNCCQNNTVSLPWSIQKITIKRISSFVNVKEDSFEDDTDTQKN